MSKTIENLKSGNYEVVDNQGFSVTQHFIECLEKEFVDLEAKLEEKDEQIKRRIAVYEKQFIEQTNENCELKQQLAEKDKEIEKILKENEELVIKYNVYNYGDKIQQDKVYSITGEALELLINRPNQKAMEQLEKVKDIINASVRDDHIIWDFDIKEHIDNQINELKGEEV